ncbi:hypothetical protein F5878DRAFT_525570 [Lentinula raphanica]|uniref:F-box domain-containing protein n=1 Tax=Lentinula raphanica TaxID=153919 RepID=A0AA38PKG0_9AGAR|nr:hypothetical protein F5878DRAFT_525570 [Lentinula raphanica]
MPTSLSSLPVEVLEHIAFYYVCPRVLGPPVPLTTLLLLSKTIFYKLSEARHLYARVFKHKFSSNAIRRRGFEPRVGEWASQLRWWLEVLKGVRNRRRRPGDEAYLDDIDAEEVGVSETMYALWIMCLEDNGCNRAQMQLAGVYEWVEGYIRTEMYKNLDKGWPLANAENSCAMWIFWYLSSKARLMEETPDQRESLVQLVLPFVTVPFRYPSAFAPANHFRLPLRSAAYSSSSTPFSIPTPHGPYPIYLHPNRHTWLIPHFDRWTALSTPLASDAAKLVYFSRRELMLFNVPPFLPPNREDHRARVRARLAAENNGEVDEARVQMVFRNAPPYTDSPAAASDSQQNMVMVDEQETNEQVPPEQDDSDMQRDPTMFTGYPQQGAVYTPGQLNGLWTGRMIVTGHRPNPFNEDTLRLAAVPLYVRFSEYAIYSGGTPIPCANDTDLNDDIPPDNAFDQGIRDAWFPPNAKLSANPDRLTVSVPSSGLTDREDTYDKRKPGTFHDRDTCPGCKARENALETARAQIPVGVDARSELIGNSQEQDELPPYVPSVETIPPCNGIRDVVITGSTDPRHAAAWGDWVWRGRVRKWDGMVGLVRSPNGSSAGNGGGKIFFYGTVIRGKNLVGTWRLAHEDPRMPAYEGAFTLGRKDE